MLEFIALQITLNTMEPVHMIILSNNKGLYLHEHEASEHEREMTAKLSAMVAKR